MRAFLACAACSDTACAATLNVPARDVPERGALCGGGHAGGAILQKDLMAIKVAELKEELEARGEAKTGCKAWLRRRLHAAIVRMHLEARDAEDGL